MSRRSLSQTERRSSLSRRRGISLIPLEDLKNKGHNVVSSQELAISRKYDLLEDIGEGAFSIVKRAVRKTDKAVFAVKTCRCLESELRAMALEEYRILSNLCHRNIIRAEELQESESSGHVWLVLEFCGGGSLRHHIHNFGPFPQEQCSVMMQDVTGCLHYLHKSGIVHRDLKPANLLLQTCAGKSPVLKIADFGSAKEIRGDAGEMLTDRGTKKYSAPELFFGLIWNERIDVWACGLCCYYMFKGRIPFSILEPTVATNLRKGSLPEICWQGLPDFFVCFLQRCLAVDMKDRPSAKELEKLTSDLVGAKSLGEFRPPNERA